MLWLTKPFQWSKDGIEKHQQTGRKPCHINGGSFSKKGVYSSGIDPHFWSIDQCIDEFLFHKAKSDLTDKCYVSLIYVRIPLSCKIDFRGILEFILHSLSSICCTVARQNISEYINIHDYDKRLSRLSLTSCKGSFPPSISSKESPRPSTMSLAVCSRFSRWASMRSW